MQFQRTCLMLLIPALLQSQISRVLGDWKNYREFKGASFGYYVMNVRSNSVVAEHNAHELMIPASTLKIITTAAALNILGPKFRYETKILYAGNFNSSTGILDGDLIIAGSGDPSLQSEYFSKDNVLETWAKALKAIGLKEVKGKIIGDASAFERTVPGEWIWADIGNYFGATPCGLTYIDNKFKLFYTSGASGTEAKLTGTSPIYPGKDYRILSNVKAKGNEDEAYVYGDPFSFDKEVKGTIPPNKTNYEVEAALPDPALLCAELLCNELEKAGILCQKKSVQSNYKNIPGQTNKKTLYTHYSPTLDKLIYFTNLKSNNQYCESLLRVLGKGNSKEGIEAVKLFCKERGLNTEELFMSDGCGLSRANLATPAFIAQLLCKIAKDSVQYKVLNNSFPVAGKSGSMSSIGKGQFIEDNMHAKTGYINHARAYCGYLKSRSGQELAFSIMLNNYTCTAREAKLKLEQFLIELGEM